MTQDTNQLPTIGGGQITCYADGTTEARIWQYDDELWEWLVFIESTLAADWNTPEEDAAWAEL